MKTIVLVIGHSSGAQGARNPSTGLTEWVYNYGLAWEMMGLARNSLDRIDMRIVHRGAEGGSGYELGQAIGAINDHHPALVLALHANAYDTTRAGHCALHHPGSPTGAEMARNFMGAMAAALGNPDRTIRRRDDLGLLNKTNAPAVIVEPFFIDNIADSALGAARRPALARELFAAITKAVAEGVI